MKILLTLFVLLFSSSVVAEDISDFQIDGMSVGDSLLDYFSEEKILNGEVTIYPNSNKFFDINLLAKESNKNSNYYSYSFSVKKGDNEYRIYNLRGIKFYENEISKCLEFKKSLINDLNIFSENIKREDYEFNYDKLADGKSMSYITNYLFKSGNIRIYCNEWSKKTKKQFNQRDAFAFEIIMQEHLDWVNNKAY